MIDDMGEEIAKVLADLNEKIALAKRELKELRGKKPRQDDASPSPVFASTPAGSGEEEYPDDPTNSHGLFLKAKQNKN